MALGNQCKKMSLKGHELDLPQKGQELHPPSSSFAFGTTGIKGLKIGEDHFRQLAVNG